MSVLTLTWTPITLVLIILLTSSFHTQAQQSRERTVTKAQVEEIVKNFKLPTDTRFTIESKEQKLKRLLGCTEEGRCEGRRSLVIKEILLRLQIRDMGEGCTSNGNYSTAIYGTPYIREFKDLTFTPRGGTVISFLPTEEKTGLYEAWQDELLDTGLTFCNPFKHLSCSSISKKCECRPGTVWKPEKDQNRCSTFVGSYCWIPGVNPPPQIPQGTIKTPQGFIKIPSSLPELYDPITSDFDRGIYINPAWCLEQFYAKIEVKCTPGFFLFLNGICTNRNLYDLDDKLEIQFRELPRLNFTDSCNLEHQTQLFTTTDAEVNDYKIRVKNLEAILEAKTPFCDLKLLLMCGNEGKCECIIPTTYNPDTKLCTFENPHNACQGQTTFERMTAKFPGRVGIDVMEGFRTTRDRDCRLGCAEAKFPGGRLVVPNFSFCRPCSEDPNSSGSIRNVGKNCDNSLTLFLEGAPPPSLPIDIPEYEKQVELFVQFNEKAKEFEKLFRLVKNTKCDYAGELEVYRTIRRIKNVELPEKVFTEQNYQDLMSSMDKIIGQFGGKDLCQYRLRGQPGVSDSPPRNRPLLLCGPSAVNPICYEPNNTFYLDLLMKRLSGKSAEATQTSPTCAPHVRDILKYAEDQFRQKVPSPSYEDPTPSVPTGLSTEAYEYLFNTLENIWIDNSQFCNRTAGIKCTKSVDDNTNMPGKCVFSRELLEDVLAELEQAERDRLAKLNITSKSSHHSTQHLLPTLLFILHIILLN